MHWDSEGRLVFKKSTDFLTTPFHGKNDITQEVLQMAQMSGIGDEYMLDKKDALGPEYKTGSTLPDSNIYIWAHGNIFMDKIGAGDEVKTPAQTLEALIWLGLKSTHSGTIVVWSCWSASEKGFCPALAKECYSRGYRSLTVTGSKLVTGSLINGFPTVRDTMKGQTRAAKKEDVGEYLPTGN